MTKLLFGIRPEDIIIKSEATVKDIEDIILTGFIEKVSYSGREAVYHIRVKEDFGLLVNIYCPDEPSIDEIGEKVELIIPKDSIMIFNKNNGLRFY